MFIVYLLGAPGSGKTTLQKAMVQYAESEFGLNQNKLKTYNFGNYVLQEARQSEHTYSDLSRDDIRTRVPERKLKHLQVLAARKIRENIETSDYQISIVDGHLIIPMGRTAVDLGQPLFDGKYSYEIQGEKAFMGKEGAKFRKDYFVCSLPDEIYQALEPDLFYVLGSSDAECDLIQERRDFDSLRFRNDIKTRSYNLLMNGYLKYFEGLGTPSLYATLKNIDLNSPNEVLDFGKDVFYQINHFLEGTR